MAAIVRENGNLSFVIIGRRGGGDAAGPRVADTKEASMKIANVLAAATLVGASCMSVAPSFAHHSFAAEFDGKNCRDFTGTLTKLDWQSPHPYFYMDIKDATGKTENWSFQTYAPITLRRNGTDRQVFIDNMGKSVWVRGCLARNGKEHYAAA